MRYGYSLKELVEKYVPQGTTVGQTTGGDDGTLQLTSMTGELQNVQEQGVGGAAGKAIVKQAGKYADRATDGSTGRGRIDDADARSRCAAAATWVRSISICIRAGSSSNELDAAYPGLVDALVQHEGIGVVVVADEAGVPIALGKNGQRNLHTGQVTGDDPMKMYGDPDLRAAQVRRVADFPHVGDHHGVEHGVSRWDRGGDGGIDRQSRRHGRRADRCVLAASRVIWWCRRRATRPICLRILNARRGTPGGADRAEEEDGGRRTSMRGRLRR